MTEVTIAALGRRGEGITEIGGQPVFVPFTLPGEVVEIAREGDSDRAVLLAVKTPSPDRIAPFCRYFGTCGGCALQHAGPATYAAFKRELVTTSLARAGIDAPVAATQTAHGVGRRRATLHVRAGRAGYMRARTHDMLDIEACPILAPPLRKAAPEIARAIGRAAGDCDVAFTLADNGLDIAIKTMAKAKPKQLMPLAQQLRPARLTLGRELVFQEAAPEVTMGPARVRIPEGGFLQATEAAEAQLAGLVAEAVAGQKHIADLFCGVGPFALRLARTARIFAADYDKPAIAALDEACRRTSGLKPIEAKARDLFREPLVPVELAPFDAVVFDPPRAGAEAQCRELAKSKVKLVVGVSCDALSFARDAAILIAGGYRLEAVTPLDQFAWSPHVELVGVFRR